MNDLVKYLMAWGWPGAILPSGNHPGTSKKPSGIWRLAGLLAGLPWAGLDCYWAGWLFWAGWAWLGWRIGI